LICTTRVRHTQLDLFYSCPSCCRSNERSIIIEVQSSRYVAELRTANTVGEHPCLLLTVTPRWDEMDTFDGISYTNCVERFNVAILGYFRVVHCSSGCVGHARNLSFLGLDVLFHMRRCNTVLHYGSVNDIQSRSSYKLVRHKYALF
jgi:hypothetical protein